MNVDDLAGYRLDLLFYLSIGYKDFEYYQRLSCWRIEKQFSNESKLKFVGIVPDVGCLFKNHPYIITYSSDPTFILREMKDEGIALSWGQDKEFCLHLQAFPEIKASDRILVTAFKRIMVKKEFGEFINQDLILAANIFRDRVTDKRTLT